MHMYSFSFSCNKYSVGTEQVQGIVLGNDWWKEKQSYR